ncbi:pleiotropic regulator 1-like [Protopterus annectens]|uniref:pleiotropic regulator 1-like n=1 Tax=Protopterus annectens TaxID=7888 RepID=UPI001CFA0314|nr:pleiotropic regulator 1-like [Protopterus annectens]
MMYEEVQKHSVHTLIFRSLKRTHDMFVSDHAKPVSRDETSHKVKMAIKLHVEYGPVRHLPAIKEEKEKTALPAIQYGNEQSLVNEAQSPQYMITGTHPYPSGPGVQLSDDTQLQKMPSEEGAQSMALAISAQARQNATRTSASVSDILKHASSAERSQAPASSVVLEGTKNSALVLKKAPSMPKPQWHPPWKLYRVSFPNRGQSKRKFKVRVEEHIRDIKKNRMESSIAMHYFEKHDGNYMLLQATIPEKVFLKTGDERLLKNALLFKEATYILKYNTLVPVGLNLELDWKCLI